METLFMLTFWGECTDHRWFFLTNCAEFWCVLWTNSRLFVTSWRSCDVTVLSWNSWYNIHLIYSARSIVFRDKRFVNNTWWRHQMETCSALQAFCEGNSPVTGEFPSQRPVARNFNVFFDLHLNKRLSKQSRGWWFETPSRTLWHHRNEALASSCPCAVCYGWLSTSAFGILV